MNRLTGLILFSISAIYCNGQVKKLETTHFEAKYELEAEDYVLASLKVLDVAWNIATENGFELPEKIKFIVIPSKRNVIYFDRKTKSKITWEYTSLNNFLPPNESRKKNIYGLCHEVAHLCMYRTFLKKPDWVSYDYTESWADFYGNYLIDSVFLKLGTDFWPEPHDYTKSAGMLYLNDRIIKNNPELNSFNKASKFWCELTAKIGIENIFDLFNEITTQKVENPNAKDKYSKVLTLFIDENINNWFDQYTDYLIINNK